MNFLIPAKLDQIGDPAGPQSLILTQMITDYNLVNQWFWGVMCLVPQVNYTQPLVAVKFLNASLNTDINVECKVTSNTLMAGSERDKFAGRVSFKLRIDGQEDQWRIHWLDPWCIHWPDPWRVHWPDLWCIHWPNRAAESLHTLLVHWFDSSLGDPNWFTHSWCIHWPHSWCIHCADLFRFHWPTQWLK